MNHLKIYIIVFFLFASCQPEQKQNKPESSDTVSQEQQGNSLIDTGLRQDISSISQQFEVKEIDKNYFKKRVDADLLKAYEWNDKNGRNVLLISRKGPVIEENSKWGEEARSAFIFAEQLNYNLEKETLLWDIYDFEKDCVFDLWIGLVPNSIRITDLDNNGYSETTLVYKKSCRSDVSPSEMKLIMHENDSKMALRGMMSLEPLGSDFNPNLSDYQFVDGNTDMIAPLFGRYKNETDFAQKPKEFLAFARNHWLENSTKDDFIQFYDDAKIVAP